jgi:hypothetical protein
MTAAITLAGIVFLLVTDHCGGCQNEIRSETRSPGGLVKAVVFIRACGATTGFGTHVSVLPASESLHDGTGNVLIADSDHGKATTGPNGELNVRLQWKTDGRLLIAYPIAARVFRSEVQHGDIAIEYRPE